MIHRRLASLKFRRQFVTQKEASLFLRKTCLSENFKRPVTEALLAPIHQVISFPPA